MPGVRKGSVDKSVNVQESGALNKALLNVTRQQLITEYDCGTKKGIELLVSEGKDIIDRSSAEVIPGVLSKDELIDEQNYSKILESKVSSIKVRSPLTCEAPTGVCVLCYGSLPDGNLPDIGYNVGVADAQAVTERSTQLTMRTFHTGGATTSGEGGVTEGFGRILELIEVPEILSNKAVLATRGGKINKIETNALGGKDVTIDNAVTLRIPKSRTLIVKKNAIVQKGDALTIGSVKPQELAALQTHEKAQQYIVDELDKIYNNSFHKKTFENVVRAVSNNAEITEAPDDSEYLKGDRSTVQFMNHVNKKRKEAGQDPLKYKKYFRSVKMLPGDSRDWLSRLGTSRLKQTIIEGAASGMSSNIHGHDPIPAYMYGEEFGKMLDKDGIPRSSPY